LAELVSLSAAVSQGEAELGLRAVEIALEDQLTTRFPRPSRRSQTRHHQNVDMVREIEGMIDGSMAQMPLPDGGVRMPSTIMISRTLSLPSSREY